MPHVSQTVHSPIRDTFRVEQVRGLFDLPRQDQSRETFAAELPALDEDWSLGAIIGPSGSGKTTLARAAYGSALYQSIPWPADQAVIDGFGRVPIKRLAQVLTAVGFGSPPAWLRPYYVLSGGEKFRCELARAVLRGIEPAQPADTQPRLVVFDEFTSVVDRTVARCASAALARLIRRWKAFRFVAVTCHYDILEWLAPDWRLDMASGALARGRLQRPEIRLRVFRCRQRLWQLFARHHYLSGTLPPSATCYVALWNGVPVAFCAVIGQLGHRGRKRITRVVTLPDYQGLGIGMKLAERVAQAEMGRGFRVSISTSHPAVIAYCEQAPGWNSLGVKRLGGTRQQIGSRIVAGSTGRGVAAFEWQGEGRQAEPRMGTD